jgi:LysM repeat protein
MKTTRLQTKRTAPRGSLFRRLQASTSRRHRVAAAGPLEGIELQGDVPNVGVARALLIILALHLVAIAGIFVHNRYFDGQQAASAAPKVVPPVVAGTDKLPKLADDDKPHMIVTGDTYESVAKAYGVEPDDLRRANDNMALRAGRILQIPQRIVAVEPVELANRREASRMGDRGRVEGGAEPAGGSPEAPKAAVLVRATKPVLPAGSAAGAESSLVGAKSYTVKQGDSLWRIATRHGLTPERLMEANGIKDAKRLRAGIELKIPKS